MIHSKQMAKINLIGAADCKIFKLVAEAYRIKSAYCFEHYSAVYSSSIDPLPHQISAVYEKMLPRQPLRFLLADDPGAGKTIMTGLLIKELIVRGDLRRCLIICPKTLVEQWQEELQQKFHITFQIITGENLSAGGNIFSAVSLGITSIDVLARNKNFQDKLQVANWDLIVCDEAHKMSATISGKKIRYTKRFQLGKLLGKITRHFLLLTATPHNGKKEDFHFLMSLIAPDRFEGVKRIKQSVDVSDIMRRLVKEDLITFEGKPLFPERIACTVNYSMSAQEMKLYQIVTDYVADNFNRAERLAGDKKNSVGFAMTILQRRLASSPKAIYNSLKRRTDRLKKILREKKFSSDRETYFSLEDMEDYEDLPNGDFETKEDELAERVTSSKNISEVEKEIQTLEYLTKIAWQVFISGEDKKWQELSQLLQEEKFSKTNGEREKLIIFTEHRDTLDYLREKISSLFGRDNAVVAIHGGLNYRERRKVEEQFKQDKNVFVLVATDAAGEGINLQNAHLMINYDLPWNPNRLEQRFGRIHRIGQKEICYMWNLVANNTREGQVFRRLLEKLEHERIALGGKVFDILGRISFDNKPLRELLIEAICHGNEENVLHRLDKVIDTSFDANKLQKLLQERALTKDTISLAKVANMVTTIERNETHKLQPHSVENFFVAAFKKLGGQIYPRGNGLYKISHMPHGVKNKILQISPKDPSAKSGIVISFPKENSKHDESDNLIFPAPGHPLIDAVCSLLLEQFGNVLQQGTIFVDDNDEGQSLRVLFLIETKIQDARADIISRQVHFVEILENGQSLPVGHAPYLDYRSPTTSEHEKISAATQISDKLNGDIESLAVDFALKNLIPNQLQQAVKNKKAYLDRLETAVKKRLKSEINYWDNQAILLKAKDKSKSARATQTADDLASRLKQRLDEIALQRKISAAAPAIVAKALIVPKGFLSSSEPILFSNDAQARSHIEKIAMNAVMNIERDLKNSPVDVSESKCGYDIESREPNGHLRFIEVKGRISSADTVTISKNEILTALNSTENFILAIVKVSGNSAHVFYLQTPFTSPPDFNAVSVNYDIKALIRQAKVLLEKVLNI